MEEWVEMWGGAPLMIEERRAQWWKQAKKQLLLSFPSTQVINRVYGVFLITGVSHICFQLLLSLHRT